MSLKSFVIAVAVAVSTSVAWADDYAPSHSCSKPYKPYQFNSRWEVDNFYDDVERYKRCIQEFVDEQREAIENHRTAASDAIEEWNRYARYELRD